MMHRADSVDFFDYTDPELSTGLIRAVMTNDPAMLKKLCQERKKQNRRPIPADNRGWNLLHISASLANGHHCLKLLLLYRKYFMFDLNALTFENETALFLACKNNNLDSAVLLLERRCDPNINNIAGVSPLHAAVSSRNPELTQILLKHGANVNHADWDGTTALHISATKGCTSSCRILLDHGAADMLIDSSGNIPLHSACGENYFDIVQMLAEHSPQSINCQNNDGLTPLMMTVCRANIKCVDFLLQKNCDTCSISSNGSVALHYALSIGNAQIVEKLLAHSNSADMEKNYRSSVGNVIDGADDVCFSLTCCAIYSGSAECLAIISKSELSRSILEAPQVENCESVLRIFSPLAFLFSTHHDDEVLLNAMLKILIDSDIIFMRNFSRKFGNLWGRFCKVEFVSPFPEKIKQEYRVYLQSLMKHQVTVDYCVECYYDIETRLVDFGTPEHLESFYGSLVNAVLNDDDKVVHFFLSNSNLLQPSHVCNFIRQRVLPNDTVSGNKICQLLYSIPSSILVPHGHHNHCINLQNLCRAVIRNSLKMITVRENLNYFRSNLMRLPLPIHLLHFLCYNDNSIDI